MDERKIFSISEVKKVNLFFNTKHIPFDPEKPVNHFNLKWLSGTYSFKYSSVEGRI